MSITNLLYNSIFKRTSTLTLFMVSGAFLLEGGINIVAESIFNSVNQGKLWHHIKDNYKPKE